MSSRVQARMHPCKHTQPGTGTKPALATQPHTHARAHTHLLPVFIGRNSLITFLAATVFEQLLLQLPPCFVCILPPHQHVRRVSASRMVAHVHALPWPSPQPGVASGCRRSCSISAAATWLCVSCGRSTASESPTCVTAQASETPSCCVTQLWTATNLISTWR